MSKATEGNNNPIILIMSFLLLMACGLTQPISSNKIVNGEPVQVNSFPIVAFLKQDSRGDLFVYCSGAMISSRHILTAAHCSLDATGSIYPLDSIWVVAQTAYPEAEASERLSVAAIHPHADFKVAKMGVDAEGLLRLDATHDIAIWELEEERGDLIIASILHPTAMDTEFINERPVAIMGFGRRSVWDSPFAPHELTVAKTPYFTNVPLRVSKHVIENGRSVRRKVEYVVPGRSAWEFYAGGRGYPDTCNGDSGSPAFFIQENDSLILIGITSRGTASCDLGGIYTLAPAHMNWIKAIVPMAEFSGL